MQQERVRTQPSPLRCPYCHEDVSVEARDWVACEECLGRHHSTCWQESGHCSTCQADACLRGDAARIATEEQIEPTDDLYRLIDAHERASENKFLDYLLNPLTLGLYAPLRAETRLLGHLRRDRDELLTPQREARAKRYQLEALDGAERGARIRRVAAAVAFGVCALTVVLGGLCAEYHWAGWDSDDLGGFMIFLGIATWAVLSQLVFLGLHWSAVRRHDGNQLYLGLLGHGSSEDEAREALAQQRSAYSKTGLLLTGLSLPLMFVPFLWWLLPFSLARAFQQPLSLHQTREGTVRELFPPRTAEKD